MAGLLALAAGAVAMSAGKGGRLHRRAGIVFVCAMLVMSALGAVLAVLKPTRISILAAMLTFYLVGTALLTVRRSVRESRPWVVGFMMLGFAAGALGLIFGVVAANRGTLDGLSPIGYFVFAAITLAAAQADARLLRAGSIEGTRRLIRHLSRMSLAMFVATASFFLGQARIFPEAVRESGLLAAPVVLVVLFLIYWLVRMLLRGRAERAALS
jgi:hypothetical protein